MRTGFRAALPLLLAMAVGACGGDSSGPGKLGQVRVRAHDSSDLGVGGVVLTLTSGANVLTATTNFTGVATFESVPAGDWQLDADIPSGYQIASTQEVPITFNMYGGQVKDVAVALAKTIPDDKGGGGGLPKE